ncbi:hypothetical protein HDU76_008369, partial [Blyttiomyces sp. JEL0837]
LECQDPSTISHSPIDKKSGKKNSKRNNGVQHTAAAKFDSTWLPTPMSRVVHVRQQPIMKDSPIHISDRYSDIVVSFPYRVVSNITNLNSLPNFNAWLLTNVNQISNETSTLQSKQPVTITNVTLLPFNSSSPFESRYKLSLSLPKHYPDYTMLEIQPSEMGCFDSVLPNLGCNGRLLVPLRDVPRFDAGLSVSRVGFNANANAVGGKRGMERWRRVEVLVAFSESVGVAAADGTDMEMAMGMDRIRKEDLWVGLEDVDGIDDEEVVALRVLDVAEVKSGAGRTVRVSVLVPGMVKKGVLVVRIGDGGKREEKEVEVAVEKRRVYARAWPRLEVVGEVKVLFNWGICCGSKKTVSVFNPSHCPQGTIFNTDITCKTPADSTADQLTLPSSTATQKYIPTLPKLKNGTHYLGAYVNGTSPDFTTGIECPVGSKLNTVILPTVSEMLEKPAIFSVVQKCLPSDDDAELDTSEIPPLHRILHVKPSPPIPAIVSLSRDSDRLITLQVRFSIPVGGNEGLPKSSIKAVLVRGNLNRNHHYGNETNDEEIVLRVVETGRYVGTGDRELHYVTVTPAMTSQVFLNGDRVLVSFPGVVVGGDDSKKVVKKGEGVSGNATLVTDVTNSTNVDLVNATSVLLNETGNTVATVEPQPERVYGCRDATHPFAPCNPTSIASATVRAAPQLIEVSRGRVNVTANQVELVVSFSGKVRAVGNTATGSKDDVSLTKDMFKVSLMVANATVDAVAFGSNGNNSSAAKGKMDSHTQQRCQIPGTQLAVRDVEIGVDDVSGWVIYRLWVDLSMKEVERVAKLGQMVTSTGGVLFVGVAEGLVVGEQEEDDDSEEHGDGEAEGAKGVGEGIVTVPCNPVGVGVEEFLAQSGRRARTSRRNRSGDATSAPASSSSQSTTSSNSNISTPQSTMSTILSYLTFFLIVLPFHILKAAGVMLSWRGLVLNWMGVSRLEIMASFAMFCFLVGLFAVGY